MPLTPESGSPRTLARLLALAAALALAAILTLPGTAGAHADLVQSSPPDRAVLAAEPQQVTLVFSEKVTPALSAVTVVAPSGRRVDEGGPASVGPGGNRIAVHLGPETQHGTYVVTWRTTASDDGHTTSGALTFSVGSPTSPGAAANATAAAIGGRNRLTNAVLDVAIWLGFAGLAGMVGFTAVRTSCLPEVPATPAEEDEDEPENGTDETDGTDGAGAAPAPPWASLRWPAAAGWALLLAGTVVQLLVYGPAAQGESLAHTVDRPVLSATLSTHMGHTLVARIMLLALVAAVGEQILRHRRAGAAGALPLALLLALTWSEISHAPGEPHAALAVLVTTLHVTAMAVWAGGVATLVVLLTRHRDPSLAGTARRFSRLALAAVALLIATGTYQAWRQVGSLGALTGTHYGRLLLLKVGLVLAVLATAAVRHTRDRRPAPARAPDVRRSVLAELAGITGVLVVTVLLTATAPSRTTAPASAPQHPPAPPAVAAR
ncbi:MAG: copper resistance protein CopC/CopD [Streptomyces sp.]|nr:copper resistance protein CopC/CopD [Streptomyces sp.]